MKLKGAIFDMDGTLLDSMWVWETLGENYLRGRNLEPPANLLELLKPKSLLEAAEYFRLAYGIQEDAEEIVRQILQQIKDHYDKDVLLKEHVCSFLQALSSAEIPLCVATATARPLAEVALKRLQIYDCFQFMITCEEAGEGKQSPKIYEDALQKLGTKKEETVVFEDAFHAVQTAKKAGFLVAAIQDKSAQADEVQIRALADWYITSYAEAQKLFR